MTKVDVSKENAYTVLSPATDRVAVAKLTGYAVMKPSSSSGGGPALTVMIVN